MTWLRWRRRNESDVLFHLNTCWRGQNDCCRKGKNPTSYSLVSLLPLLALIVFLIFLSTFTLTHIYCSEEIKTGLRLACLGSLYSLLVWKRFNSFIHHHWLFYTNQVCSRAGVCKHWALGSQESTMEWTDYYTGAMNVFVQCNPNEPEEEHVKLHVDNNPSSGSNLRSWSCEILDCL